MAHLHLSESGHLLQSDDIQQQTFRSRSSQRGCTEARTKFLKTSDFIVHTTLIDIDL